MKFFLQIITICFLTILTMLCASNDSNLEYISCGGRGDNWIGNRSKKISQRPYDYYFTKFVGIITPDKLRYIKNPSFTCKENILKRSREDFILKMISDTIDISEKIKDEQEMAQIRLTVTEKYLKEKDKVQVMECRALYPDDPNKRNSGWKECECILYLHVPGGKDRIVKEALQLQKINL